MTRSSSTSVFNGRLLPDDAPTDFVLWREGRDYQVIEHDSIPPPPRVDRQERGWGIAGLMLVPQPT